MFGSNTATAAFEGLSFEESGRKPLNRGVIAGAFLAIGLITLGAVFSGEALSFLSPASLAIVLGGTLGATMIHYSPREMAQAWSSFKQILFENQSCTPQQRIAELVDMAAAVRKHGLLVLEREARSSTDPFMRVAFELTVDGQKQRDIKRILETEIRTSYGRASRSIGVFETLGQYSPAMGLIGTLIGLIQMLGALDDPARVGPAMAVALITTLYGAIMANVVFLPVAGKLRNQAEEESLVKSITIEGVLGLGRQENPIVIEQKLQGFLPLGMGVS